MQFWTLLNLHKPILIGFSTLSNQTSTADQPSLPFHLISKSLDEDMDAESPTFRGTRVNLTPAKLHNHTNQNSQLNLLSKQTKRQRREPISESLQGGSNQQFHQIQFT